MTDRRVNLADKVDPKGLKLKEGVGIYLKVDCCPRLVHHDQFTIVTDKDKLHEGLDFTPKLILELGKIKLSRKSLPCDRPKDIFCDTCHPELPDELPPVEVMIPADYQKPQGVHNYFLASLGYNAALAVERALDKVLPQMVERILIGIQDMVLKGCIEINVWFVGRSKKVNFYLPSEATRFLE